MHNLHQTHIPPRALNNFLHGNAGSPSAEPQFNSDPGAQALPLTAPFTDTPAPPWGNRVAQNEGGGGSDPSGFSGRLDASLQNTSSGIGQGGGPMQWGISPVDSTAPRTASPNAIVMTAPSPSSILSNTPSMSHQSLTSSDPMSSRLFPNDFIQSVASTLEELDPPAIFRQDGDFDFERDLAEWFRAQSVSMDLK
ncbi:hypothetical protein A0H81_06476 [Grifola frondosa]|uniref:Uncharacterized protein n=1 Tax=Grifola frondosa TaxID=5627 RepID=A0A1C7MCB5_GRIFR|nr:hypothetical protein A0H81_06476 [Grifola frondosa]